MAKIKTSLVTGGAGFIGSHVADHLLKMGHRVIVFDDLSGGFSSNINKEWIFVRGSINNKKLLDKIFSKYKFYYVYHLAAYAAEGLSHFIRNFNYENNVIGSINLINRSVSFGIKHFIFTSSIAVYGTNQAPMIETLTPMPEDPYGIAKYSVELDLKAAHEMFGLVYTIFRPHNVYGQRQNLSDPYRNVLGIFIGCLLQRKPMSIFGGGKQTRAFTDINDVAPHIANVIEIKNARNEIFNIGADKVYSVFELSKKIAKAMNVEHRVKFLPSRKEVMHAFSNHEKFKSTFNVTQEINIDIGIKRMVEWAKSIVIKEPKRIRNIELFKNMPPSWNKIAK